MFSLDDVNDNHEVHRADTARALAWWRHLEALHEATKPLHRAMWLASYLPHSMVVAFVIDNVTFYYILDHRVAINLFLYQFIDSIKLLWPPPPPTTLPPRICAGSCASIKSELLEVAEAYHGGDCCDVCCVNALILVPRREAAKGQFCHSRPNPNSC